MSKMNRQPHGKAPAPSQQAPWALFLLALAFSICLLTAPANAAEPEDDFLDIVAQIHEADTLSASGKDAPAVTLYKQAQTNLFAFRKNNPTWNTKMVALRLTYLQDKTTPASPTAQSQAAGKPQPAKGGKEVKLLQAGGEQRQALRLKPEVGAKQSLNLNFKMAMEVKMGAVQPPATKIPAIDIPMELTVKAVADNGDITYELVMGEPSIVEETGIAPQVMEAMKASLTGLKGSSGTGRISDRGLTLAWDLKTAGADPQSKQLMDQMKDWLANIALPLPEEPVGPGARWEAKTPLKSQGIAINQTATYELVSLEGSQVTIKSSVTQSAGSQKIQNPTMPGMPLDLIKMTGTGAGDSTMDLAKAFPVTVTAKSRSELTMSMTMGGQKQAMSMKNDLTLKLESK